MLADNFFFGFKSILPNLFNLGARRDFMEGSGTFPSITIEIAYSNEECKWSDLGI